MIRKCNYRNCIADISHMRTNAKFCSISHRRMEHTYLRRRVKLIEKYKEKGLKQVEFFKKLKDILSNSK